jgi:methionine-rich copper-binding protein CopC
MPRIAALSVMTFLATFGAAFAHSFPKTTEPPAGGTVHAAPAEVVIVFTEALEPHFSTIEVFNSHNQRVDSGVAHADPKDAHRFIVGLKKLGPGTYKVVWHATSVDTHKTQGSYTFTVAR